MEYTIKQEKNHLVISGLKDFNLTHIFECGQAFRWEKTDNGYIAINGNSVSEFVMKDKDLLVFNCTKDEFIESWHSYFDLDNDYGKIKKSLEKTYAYKENDSLKNAIEFGSGIRILNQDQFEMIISFIISANNQIPRIKNSIRIISENYGEYIGEYKGKKYYSFPSPEVLSKVDPIELKELARVGFRNERIVETSKIYLENKENFSDKLTDEVLGENLLNLPGVGPKVRDCILLFGYARYKTFPVDVWVKRLMETLYIHKTIPNKKILEEANKYFGDIMGLAQQYLFYYARENKIGK